MVGIAAHQFGQYRGHCAHTVGHGVGELHQHRQSFVVKALHHPGLPQRPIPVKPLPMQFADQSGQLVDGARLGQPDTIDVISGIEPGVLDPHRLTQRERLGEQTLPENRCLRGSFSQQPGNRPGCQVAAQRAVAEQDSHQMGWHHNGFTVQ